MAYDHTGMKINVGDTVVRVGTNLDWMLVGDEGRVTRVGLGRIQVDGVDDLEPSRFAVVPKQKRENNMTVRKFWMVASDVPEIRFRHDKYREFGGAPYKKYYCKKEALNAISQMATKGNSYYLLEAVEHHAPTVNTVKTEL